MVEMLVNGNGILQLLYKDHITYPNSANANNARM
jgi:hypothetical protein